MPELPLSAPMTASAPSIVSQAMKAKSEMSNYAELLREINSFANSPVGQKLVERIAPGTLQKGPVGDPKPAQGDFKPMPQTDPGPFFAGNGPAPRPQSSPNVSPSATPAVQVVERIVQVPTPIQPTPDQLYDASLSGLMQLADHVGKEKTLEEAIQWVRDHKELVKLSFQIKK